MQRGFILIYVILLLALLSLSAVFILERSISEQKMSLALLQAYQRDAELMAGLQEGYYIVSHDLEHCTCYFEAPHLPSPIKQGNRFWQTQPVCHGVLHKQSYDYAIERLSDLSCATYYRVTSHLPGKLQQAMEAIIMVAKQDQLSNRESDCFIDQEADFNLYQQLQLPQMVSWYRVE